MNQRPSIHEIKMNAAIDLARRSTCLRKHVGCVLVRDTRTIVEGYNGSLPKQPHCDDPEHSCLIGPDGGCMRTLHAERNLIAFAAKYGIATNDTTLYITLTPCYACSQLIVAAGIKRVIYLEEYRKTDGIDLLKENGVEVIRYVNLEREISTLCR